MICVVIREIAIQEVNRKNRGVIMKTMLRTTLLGLLAVLCLCYGALSQAYTIEDVEKAGN